MQGMEKLCSLTGSELLTFPAVLSVVMHVCLKAIATIQHIPMLALLSTDVVATLHIR